MTGVSEKDIKTLGRNDQKLANWIGEVNSSKAGKVWVVGMAMAVTVSWSLNKSILWMIVHGVLAWFYVVYYMLGFGR